MSLASVEREHLQGAQSCMTTRPITLKGYKLDKHGKLVKHQPRQSVSDRLRQKKSKRVRVEARRGIA